MNKTPEEAWEMIETVADANQHFSTRAKVKGIYEIAPSESTMLAKSLVDIAAMLKEIKEGQQVTPMLLKRQTDHSQQNLIKYCGVCLCNSHHTNECPQLQEDNLVASTHNFYSATAILPYNKQYYMQGSKDEQQNQWSSPQQNQLRQPYNPPRNNQNTKYQPPQNRQQYPPTSNQQMSEDEIFRALQQGNQETKEFNRQAMIQLNQVTELLHKMLSQQTQPLPKPPTNIPNPLPSQPLPNPKGGLNAFNDKLESEEEAVTTNNEEAVQQLCETLIEVTDTGEKDTGGIFDFYEEFESDYKEE
ncbi:hypothetical protein PIB30_039712 [Stylosanthes scabra]|uniref:Uncharacterized protein n=1 Tax=Stylosanthes scabra TaxID=79078 RepID=A0ABU6ZD21_9FABA|nr:hypothetical protein [Stylosanthes scabra]